MSGINFFIFGADQIKEENEENLRENERKWQKNEEKWGNVPLLPTRGLESGYTVLVKI